MKLTEMRSKNIVELKKQVEKHHTRINQLGTDLYSKEVKDIREIRKLKKEVARMLTIIRQKEEEK